VSAGGEQARPGETHGQRQGSGEGGAAAHHGHRDLRRRLDQAGPLQRQRERPRPPQVAPHPARRHRQERPLDAPQRRRHRELRDERGVLDDQPAAGRQPGGEALDHLVASPDVLQHEPGVDQVELVARGLVRRHVVAQHADTEVGQAAQVVGVQLGRGDVGRSGPVGQPAGDRAGAGPHLQAAPALGDTGALQVADGELVVRLLHQQQAPVLVGRARHGPPLPARRRLGPLGHPRPSPN